MSIHCTADAEKDVSMKKLKSEEAITTFKDMKVDIPVPKAAVTQIKRNAAIEMAIDAMKAQADGDTISRKAAIEAVIEWYGCEPSDMDDFKEILAKQPSAQPEIVRCKDCKHWSRESICDGFCSEDCMRHDEDFYCGYAERKTNE